VGGVDEPSRASERDQRFDRQRRFHPLGDEGQRRLGRSQVLVLGVGALGAASAEMLLRAGVGRLRLVDRDLVEWSNLQRQGLFREQDAREGLPKAVAAARRLQEIDAQAVVDAQVVEARVGNLPALIAGCDLVIDGLDSFHTRHLLNEACVRAGVPWIYGACVGAYGCSVAIRPGITPCLRCLQDQLPAPGESPTCDTVGIIAPAVQLVAAWQVAEALKLLSGQGQACRSELWTADLWSNQRGRLDLAAWRDPACAVCSPSATFPLSQAGDDAAVVLCGRDSVQIRRSPVALEALAAALGTRVTLQNPYLLRWADGALSASCFKDGRVLVHGTGDAALARAFCDRWLG
jgi:molybdopterin/thiamine biosynthesis adenylyltransferase